MVGLAGCRRQKLESWEACPEASLACGGVSRSSVSLEPRLGTD